MAAEPRWRTTLRDHASSWSGEIAGVARGMGVDLLPWQFEAAELIGARDSEGLPLYKTVVITVPRQQGKTLLARATLAARAAQADNLALFATAQSRVAAARSVVALGDQLLDGGADVYVLRGIGQESVRWRNGSIVRPLAPNERGGHGESIDMMLLDEAWTVTSALMGGVRPAMLARPLSQLLVISTMGTVESTVWNGLVVRGREATEDPASSVAYLEYSAPSDDAVFDRDRWAEWMPALGATITHDDVMMTLEDLDAAEAVRALGNRTTRTLSVLFPVDWLDAAWAILVPPTRMTLGVDVNEEPVGASVAAGFMAEDGRPAARLVEWRVGSPRWVAPLVADIIERRQVDAVVADFGGPARQIRDELAAVAGRVPLVERTVRDIAADTAGFHSALRDRAIILERSDVLMEALAAAVRKPIGDLWVISRKRMMVDASPLIAMILANGVAQALAVAPVVRPFIV